VNHAESSRATGFFNSLLEAKRVLHLYRRMLEHWRTDIRDVGDVAEEPMQRVEAQAADDPPAPASEIEAV
jgi:hypothetical protein